MIRRTLLATVFVLAAWSAHAADDFQTVATGGETQALRIVVGDAPAEPAAGVGASATRRGLLKTPRLAVSQLDFNGAATLPGALPGRTQIYAVVGGAVTLTGPAKPQRLTQGALVYVTGPWPADVAISGEDASLLSVDGPAANGKPLRDVGVRLAPQLLAVQADAKPAYAPAHHTNTHNRLLVVDSAIEVIRGRIGVGGGADAHKHDVQEQLGYVLSPAPPALLYMPPGVMHGGEKRTSLLDLVIIYSPPLGESLNYN